MDISIKEIVWTKIDEYGNIVRKDMFENRFDNIDKYLSNFSQRDSFVMESTGFYEPIYDFMESRGFNVKLANPLKIKLIAESRMKNDDVDSEILAKLLKNNWIPWILCPSQRNKGDKKDREDKNADKENNDVNGHWIFSKYGHLKFAKKGHEYLPPFPLESWRVW